MSDQQPVTYPEHEKLKQVSERSNACGEFIDWLRGERGYVIGEYHKHTEECRDREGFYACQMTTRYPYPTRINVRVLLAEFFKIDEAKLEEEKRAMLVELQGLKR